MISNIVVNNLGKVQMKTNSGELGVAPGTQELNVEAGETSVIKTTEVDYTTQRVCRMRTAEIKILGQAFQKGTW